VIAVRSPSATEDPTGMAEDKRRAIDRVRRIGDPVRVSWVEGIHDLPLQHPDLLARRIVRLARP
jgi:hypothetical protein